MFFIRVVFRSSLSTPLLICVRQINFCTKQFNLVLLNNLWIQDMKKSLWWQMPALKYILARSSLPRAANNTIICCIIIYFIKEDDLPWSPPRVRGCKNYPCSIALRADWKINRDHRARLVSSNRDWFAYYTNISHILYTYTQGGGGGDKNASSGFGLWAKTLRGQYIIIPFFSFNLELICNCELFKKLTPANQFQIELETVWLYLY